MSDLLIKNARIIDPSCSRDETGCILIHDTRIVPYSEAAVPEGCEVIDAKGLLAVPGLIDFHTHIAKGLGDMGIYCDLMTIPNGTTAAVDQGSCGTAVFDGFVSYIVPNCLTTVKAFMHVSPIGVSTELQKENTDPACYDRERIRKMVDKYYPEHLLGLKIRLGHTITKGQGIAPLVAAKEIAEENHIPICVHITDSEVPYKEILDLLTQGDILCHFCQGKGHTLLDENGEVVQAAREARKRGVLFDLASGRWNYSLKILKSAIDQDFLPDIISTDTISASVYRNKIFSLLYPMSYALDLGMPLMEVLRAVTATPAKYMGLEGQIGTLQPGAKADIALVELADRQMHYQDVLGDTMEGSHLFIPHATVKDGQPVYKRIEFEF